MKTGYVLPVPLSQPPDSRAGLIQDETAAGTAIRIDVDEDLRLHFVRHAPGGDPADVAVDIRPLRGAQRLDIWCTWSPLAMAIHVVDRDEPSRTVSSDT